MFISHPKSKISRAKLWFQRKWDLNVLVGNLLSTGGLVASVWGGVQGIVPWHLSATIFFMVCFQSYYCSRYYRLKHTRFSPKEGFETMHNFAEGLRRLSATEHAKCIENGQKGNLSPEELDQLIEEHRNFSHKICSAIKDIMLVNGIKISRVCLKLHVRDKIIRVASNDGPEQDRFATNDVKDQLFWKMLSNVHFHYKKWIHKDGIRALPQNTKLKERPRFLAIDDLGKNEHPKILECLTSIYAKEIPSGSENAPPPDENHNVAKDMWAQLRKIVGNRYNNCIGIMISGPAFVDPLSPKPPSSTDLVIGFIGIDSKNLDALNLLDAGDLHGVAAIADAAYAPLTNLRTLYELRLQNLSAPPI